jgi:GNAT superfamily N-acetyltransferase
MSFTVRPAGPADAPVISEFNARLAAETEGKTLERTVLARGVAALLADRQKGIYFLAYDGDEVLGQLAISYEWSDWRNGWFWWLQSVYVRADARGRGVFRSLMEHVLNEAGAAGDVTAIRLYVERDNGAGKRSYEALGFRPTSYEVYQRPADRHQA